MVISIVVIFIEDFLGIYFDGWLLMLGKDIMWCLDFVRGFYCVEGYGFLWVGCWKWEVVKEDREWEYYGNI